MPCPCDSRSIDSIVDEKEIESGDEEKDNEHAGFDDRGEGAAESGTFSLSEYTLGLALREDT